MPDGPIGLGELETMAERAALVVERLRERVFASGPKTLEARFSRKAAARWIGCSEERIRALEARATPGEAMRPPYALSDLNRIRDALDAWPERDPNDPTLTVAVQNFKGGVGKSTVVCHLAQYLALRGYRVCIVDCDSQASSTAMFGVNPDVDVDETRETIYPFLRHGGPKSLDYALRDTYWEGVSLIAANLGLYDAEYEFAARLRREPRALDMLAAGVATIKDRFDVVLLDPPPALGMISLSVLRAADGLIVPAPPNNIDFASTGHFLRMLVSTLRELSRLGGEPSFAFVKILVTKMNEAKSAHQSIKKMMDRVFAFDMMEATLKDSAEIDNASANLTTVYEVSGEEASTATHKRCRAFLDAIGDEFEQLLRSHWSARGASERADEEVR